MKGVDMKFSILFSLLLVLGLTACSPQSKTTVASLGAVAGSNQAHMPVTDTITQVRPEEKVLNFSNWVDYMPKNLLQDFERETGIKVNYRTYVTNEELESKVQLKTDSDDLVIPSLNYGKTQATLGYYQPLDKQQLSNFKNLDPDFLKSMTSSDPGNQYFVPWAWGHTTLFVNKTQITKALGGLAYPDKELDLVFNPSYTSRLKSCGIAYIDAPSEIIPLAMLYLGIEPYSQDVKNYKKATELLKSVRQDIRVFSSKMVDVISANKVCVAIAWSGNINTSIMALKKNGNKDELLGLLPESGTMMFVDGLAIPVNAKHPKNAHAFIDFYLKAQNSARTPNEINYPNGNVAALEFVNTDIKNNSFIFPPKKFFDKLVPSNSYSNDSRWAMMQEYVSFAYQLDLNK
jgi:putrescine transport system substrate-binding protein